MRQVFRGLRNRWRSCLVSILAFISLFVCWLLVGVSFNLSGQSPVQHLEAARSVWKQQGIDDYKMTVAFGSFSYIGRFFFTVRDNQITQISTNEHMLDPNTAVVPVTDTDLERYASSFGSYGSFPASLNDYTIDNLFDFAKQKLASEPTMPLVSWCSPSHSNDRTEAIFSREVGYIQSFARTNCPRVDFGGGLLCPAIGDCYAGFRITEFALLQNQP